MTMTSDHVHVVFFFFRFCTTLCNRPTPPLASEGVASHVWRSLGRCAIHCWFPHPGRTIGQISGGRATRECH